MIHLLACSEDELYAVTVAARLQHSRQLTLTATTMTPQSNSAIVMPMIILLVSNLSDFLPPSTLETISFSSDLTKDGDAGRYKSLVSPKSRQLYPGDL